MKRTPVCVDFDGTVVEHMYPEVGPAVPKALEWMKRWHEAGANLILWTMRSGATLEEAVAYLTTNGVILYGINENPSQKSWTNSPKAYGYMYVDDAAVGCPVIPSTKSGRPMVDWDVVGPLVLAALEQKKQVA